MKLNWGWGIVLAFVLFIGFILYFVVLAMTDNSADHDLVTDEYYQEELAFQNEIDATTNGLPYAREFQIEKTEEGLLISVPEKLREQNINSTLSFYRPSNEHLDFNLAISLSKPHLLIPDDRLLDGRWDIRIQWEQEGTEYLVKKSITY